MRNTLNPLPSLLRASAQDAANVQMRSQGRTQWNQDDWNLMCDTQERLVRNLYGKPEDHNQPNMCFIRFQMAEAMEKRGEFGLKSKVADVYARIEQALA